MVSKFHGSFDQMLEMSNWGIFFYVQPYNFDIVQLKPWTSDSEKQVLSNIKHDTLGSAIEILSISIKHVYTCLFIEWGKLIEWEFGV